MTPQKKTSSETFLTRVQTILGISGNALREALGVYHPWSWQLLKRGGRLPPSVVERCLAILTTEQVILLRAQIIQDLRKELAQLSNRHDTDD